MNKAEMDSRINENAELVYAPVIITLTNGVRVVNFSSPHSFEFEDGSILPAVSDVFSLAMSMDTYEDAYAPFDGIKYNFISIRLLFNPTKEVIEYITYLYNLWTNERSFDVVICPLPLISMLRNSFGWTDEMIYNSPFRTIRVKDRLTKTIYINKFCI